MWFEKQLVSTFQVKSYGKYINLEENIHKVQSDNDTRAPPFSFHFTEVIDPDNLNTSKFDKAK